MYGDDIGAPGAAETSGAETKSPVCNTAEKNTMDISHTERNVR